MFKTVTRTWNVFVGCEFNCKYCNAKRLAETRLKNSERYKNGFKPHLIERELARSFKPGEFIFAAYMGDIAWAGPDEVNPILDRIRQFPETRFLFCSKDPRRFHWPEWQPLPANVWLGTTLESNIPYTGTKAPAPAIRVQALAHVSCKYKFVSIEPMMDFHLGTMVDWIKTIKPDIVEVGADNYGNGLTEPAEWKVQELLSHLRTAVPVVVEKDGLQRLKGGYNGRE